MALGADALEFDLHLSRDGVPVVIHDPTLDRTTDASGPVRARTMAELASVDAGARFTADGGKSFPYRGQGIGVPTLEEVLAAIPDLPLIIELKTVEVARAALQVLERTGNLARIVIGSFLDDALLPFREAGVPTSPGVRTLTRNYLPAMLRAATPIPFQSLCIPLSYYGLPLPVRGFAAMMRAAGAPTHIWTVNDPGVARRLWRAGISGIITDDPGLMLRARGEAA